MARDDTQWLHCEFRCFLIYVDAEERPNELRKPLRVRPVSCQVVILKGGNSEFG